jgi:hypothetical protein
MPRNDARILRWRIERKGVNNATVCTRMAGVYGLQTKIEMHMDRGFGGDTLLAIAMRATNFGRGRSGDRVPFAGGAGAERMDVGL